MQDVQEYILLFVGYMQEACPYVPFVLPRFSGFRAPGFLKIPKGHKEGHSRVLGRVLRPSPRGQIVMVDNHAHKSFGFA